MTPPIEQDQKRAPTSRRTPSRRRTPGARPIERPPEVPLEATRAPAPIEKISVRGKFLWAGEKKFYVRGVTYGTFRPDEHGEEFNDLARVELDFAQMAAQGFNAVRTYTPPPLWMLDVAARNGLRVMVGLPWEQHVDFLSDRKRANDIESRVRAAVEKCAGHPAVLCFAIGNEIPSPIVRWIGSEKVERFLKRLHRTVKQVDPSALVTYVNYPSTEYLRDPGDVVCFNVYLESRETLEAYLARLQNIAGDRPLIMAEIGLDSRRNGEEKQAEVLGWQVRSAFGSGCAGAFVFAWTDEWHRGGHDIEDWDFGLTDRNRQIKPALDAVREAFEDVPFPATTKWPVFSIVICSYNGGRTIAETLQAVNRIEYPRFEVIVVDDGSGDGTAETARILGANVLSVSNGGLSRARNIGLAAARGDIVAYLDDDAHPDPHWLTYLAATFLKTQHVAVGGPNLPPPGDGIIAESVAASPGGPIHVLYTDTEAEHLPGCNMAIRKSALEEIGGFDPQFRVAGDDVDVCWRLHERGYTLGFCPPAMVWHHRRNSVKAYWKQQQGYGRAEAMLEHKWPEKFNSAGHVKWGGQLYGGAGPSRLIAGRGRIRFGQWGTGLFQSLYEPSPGKLRSIPLMPEWYLMIAGLAMLTLLGAAWNPLLWTALPLGIASGLVLADAGIAAATAIFSPAVSGIELAKRRMLTFVLHLLQPLARLRGRLREGLSPWPRRAPEGIGLPWRRTVTAWLEQWRPIESRLSTIEALLNQCPIIVYRGGEFDRWDMEIRGGMLGGVRLLMGVEEHGAGKQLVRIKLSPTISLAFYALVPLFVALGVGALTDGSGIVAGVLLIAAGLVFIQGVVECGIAQAAALSCVNTAVASKDAADG